VYSKVIIDMKKDTEALSINELARRALSEKSIVLPKRIHDALQNIFTKTRKNENSDNVKFRGQLIQSAGHNLPGKHEVIKGKRNSIYNALCLLYLIGTGETKKLFQHYYSTQHVPEKRDFSILAAQTEQQHLEFFCLGVVRENIEEITQHLLSTEFDLFTNKLPSPFSCNSDNTYDLTPMLKLYQQNIPWKEYMASYQKAEDYFSQKKWIEAKQVLSELEDAAIIRLPIVEYLNVKIKVEEVETKKAWDYLQKILN
jgi:hypothetical protein